MNRLATVGSIAQSTDVPPIGQQNIAECLFFFFFFSFGIVPESSTANYLYNLLSNVYD